MLIMLRSLCKRSIYSGISNSSHCLIKHHRHRWLSKELLVQDKANCRTLQHLKLQKCQFRTTSRLDIPPLVAVILRPVLRIGAFLIGRRMRKWWAGKTEKEKEQYKQWFKERRSTFLGCFGLYGLILFIYYMTHLETDPLTQRSRFIIFNKEQEKMLGKMILDAHLQTYKDNLIPVTHPAYKRLLKVIDRILVANKDLKSIIDTQWTLTVIDLPSFNSYILPGGNIFVSLDIFKIIENDDQLGIILAHEIAHSLLLHSLEALSKQFLLDLSLIIPLLFVWALFPDVAAAVINLIGVRIVDIMYNLPYSRVLEKEADEVGLRLAAKACIDVREAVVFWATLRTLVEMRLLKEELPWISSHPSHADREKNLNETMTKALELRKNSGCSVLPAIDPRNKFYEQSEKELELYFKQKGIV